MTQRRYRPVRVRPEPGASPETGPWIALDNAYSDVEERIVLVIEDEAGQALGRREIPNPGVGLLNLVAGQTIRLQGREQPHPAELATMPKAERGSLAGAALEGGWQPIATAPKDGTEILCWPDDTSSKRVFIGSWFGNGWYNNCAGDFGSGAEPTHWQPTPAPPAAQGEGEGEGEGEG